MGWALLWVALWSLGMGIGLSVLAIATELRAADRARIDAQKRWMR